MLLYTAQTVFFRFRSNLQKWHANSVFFIKIQKSTTVFVKLHTLMSHHNTPNLHRYQHFEEKEVYWDPIEKTDFWSYRRKYQIRGKGTLGSLANMSICPKISTFPENITIFWDLFQKTFLVHISENIILTKTWDDF